MGMRWLLPVALLLSACGYKGAVTRLQPPDPALTKPEQKAARAKEKEMVAEALTVPAEARPIRIDDLTVRLTVRADDPFNLPPEGTTGGRPIPFPGDAPADPDREQMIGGDPDAGLMPPPSPPPAPLPPAQPN